MQDLLLTNFDASTLSRADPLSLCLSVSFASLENSSGTAAVIDLFTIIQDFDFDTQLFDILVKSMACCRIIFVRIVKSANSNVMHIVFWIHISSTGSIFMVVGQVFFTNNVELFTNTPK